MQKPVNKGPVITAVCGKGGVGKTCISALMIKLLAENPKNRILSVDADPAMGLSQALGIHVYKTVDDIRRRLIGDNSGSSSDRLDMLDSMEYELFSAIRERENVAFLAMGRPEEDDCFCRVNSLLKDYISRMAEEFDYVIVDAEAGIEQIQRRVFDRITHLAVVSDLSLKSRNVAQIIADTAKKCLSYEKIGLIFNRITDEFEFQYLPSDISIKVIGRLHENNVIRSFDAKGISFFNFNDMFVLEEMEKVIHMFI